MLVDQGVRRQLTSLLWSSPYRGVTWEKAQQRWHAQIVHQGNPEYLGGFDCEKDAAMAYDRRASELGRHEPLNFATKQLNVAWKVDPTADADTPSAKQICDFCGQEGHVSDACPRLLKFQRLQGSLFGTAVPPTPVRQRIKPTTFMPGEGGGSAVAGDADRIKSEPTEPAQAESAGPAGSRKGSGPPAAAGSAPSSEKSKSEKVLPPEGICLSALLDSALHSRGRGKVALHAAAALRPRAVLVLGSESTSRSCSLYVRRAASSRRSARGCTRSPSTFYACAVRGGPAQVLRFQASIAVGLQARTSMSLA